MSTQESAERNGITTSNGVDSKRNNSSLRENHQLEAARRRQGLSLRCVAKRLGLSVSEARRQEDGSVDITITQLYRWQKALEAPLAELLEEPTDFLSPRVLDRARMLRIMKTALTIHAQARSPGMKRLAQVLVDQLLEMMPELEDVSAWPTVGQRRKGEEMGRIVDNPIPENWFFEAS
jgi:transcriptional regulator with XRE-family HTH domain